jgi:hypothetical protein
MSCWLDALGAMRLFEGLSEEEELGLVVEWEHTGTGDTTENVGSGTLEERLDTLLGDDLATSIDGRLVLDGLRICQWLYCKVVMRTLLTYLTRGHHHAATDGVKRVRSDTSTSGDSPTEGERGEEVALKVTSEDDGLERIVHSEVETAVDNDTSDGRHETTVETGDTIRSEGLFVDIYQAVELALTTLLGGLGIVGETGTGVVEGVDEEEGSGTGGLHHCQQVVARSSRWISKTYTTGCKVANHPHGVTITLLLVAEHRLVGVTESEVKSLGWEVTEDVGSVSAPQSGDTLRLGCAAEALSDALVWFVKTTGADHLVL